MGILAHFGVQFITEAKNIRFCHVLSEVIPYQGKPFDLNNTLINSPYLEKFIRLVLVLQSIV